MFGRTKLLQHNRPGLVQMVAVVCALMAATHFQRTVEVDIHDEAMRETIEEMKNYQREGYSSEGRFKIFKKYSRRRGYKEEGGSPVVDVLRETEETGKVQREGYISEGGLFEGLFKAFNFHQDNRGRVHSREDQKRFEKEAVLEIIEEESANTLGAEGISKGNKKILREGIFDALNFFAESLIFLTLLLISKR